MTRKELEQSWERTKGFLEAATKFLPPSISITDQRLIRYQERLEHNELELAYDELKNIGEETLLPQPFWEELGKAAINMGLQKVPEIVCATCGKGLAKYNLGTGNHNPTPEELFASGAVPVPNFGWFCTQTCGTEFENQKGRKMFQRDRDGNIRYYPESA